MTEKITPQGASSPYKPVSKDHAAKEDKRLRQACADFEAMFVYQLLKTMKKVIPQGGASPFRRSFLVGGHALSAGRGCRLSSRRGIRDANEAVSGVAKKIKEF